MSADVQSSPKVGALSTGAGSHRSNAPPQQHQNRRQSHRLAHQQQQQQQGRRACGIGANTNSAVSAANKTDKKGGNAFSGVGGGRKRSQSFSAGAGGGVGGATGGGGGGPGGGGKMFPSFKRRKKDGVAKHIIPPTKFLLGGNIRDPLNLNSLLDEDINRAMNAVTPKSSPLPTPKHRKGEVEVIIPPNINDPLNLLMMSDCENDDDDYEKMLLVSPLKRGGGGGGGRGEGGSGGGKRSKRKRRHTKSFSLKDESGNDENIGLGLVEDARPKEAAAAAEAAVAAASSAETVMEVASMTRSSKPNLKLDLNICHSSDEPVTTIKSAEAANQLMASSPASGAKRIGDAVGTPDKGLLVGKQQALAESCGKVATSTAGQQQMIGDTPASQLAALPVTSSSNTTSSSTVTSSVMTSSIASSSTTATLTKKCRKDSKDKIVSPAIPQPGAWGDKSHYHHHHHRFRHHHHHHHQLQLTPQIDKSQRTPNFKEINTRFRYGNYNRYYGYRNASRETDPRLRVLLRRRDLFEGRDVLDIGCNVGHVTLALARDSRPKSIVGVDIDRALIDAARRNVKHYLTSGSGSAGSGGSGRSRRRSESAGVGGVGGASAGEGARHQQSAQLQFPAAMPVMFGPLEVPVLPSSSSSSTVDCHRLFPHNVSFVQGNYVLDADSLLSLEGGAQFDTIICLSVTKWLHLNWGDAGLKRAFRRMYAQLRPGGHLVIEPQPWHSYKKKRNLTPEIWQNYRSIELFPHKFSQFLLSEVGFTKCEVVGTPHHHAKGFQRPIKLFTKGEVSSAPCSVRTTVEELQEGMRSNAEVQRVASVCGNVANQGGDVANDSGNVAGVGKDVTNEENNSVAMETSECGNVLSAGENVVANESGNVANEDGNSVANGSNSVASGSNNVASESNSVANGSNSAANGSNSAANESNNVANEDGNSVEQGESVAMATSASFDECKTSIESFSCFR